MGKILYHVVLEFRFLYFEPAPLITSTLRSEAFEPGKPTICIGENKDADQLRSNCEADQRFLFSLLG